MKFLQLGAGVVRNATNMGAQALASKAMTQIAGKGMKVEAENANFIAKLKEQLNLYRIPGKYGDSTSGETLRSIQ